MPQEFQGRLLPGEHILWTGKPPGGLLLGAADAFLVPFSLIWCGFIIFWEAGVIRTNAPLLFRLWGVPFLLVGAYLIAGRFVVDAWFRRKLSYAVTDQRILILRSGRSATFTALAIDRLPLLSLVEKPGGRGTIRFDHDRLPWNYRGFGGWVPSQDSTPQFLLIGDARAVYDQIGRLAAARADGFPGRAAVVQ